MAIKLNKREKISVAAAAAAVVFFLLMQFLVFPLFEENARLSRTISTRQQELDQIRLLQRNIAKRLQRLIRPNGI
jgi:hypothetical protein